MTERPKGEGPLLFDVAIEGQGISLMLRGNVIELHSSPEVIVGEYRDLFAEDATGKLISAKLSVVEGMACISVEDAGAEYPLVVDPTVWLVEAKLVAMVKVDASGADELGPTVALDGETMVVNGSRDDAGIIRGAAYVYVREGGTWNIQQRLVATLTNGTPETNDNDGFGGSLSLSGETLVVGAPRSPDEGAVYVYLRKGTSWSIQQKLTTGEQGASRFGFSVSIDGDSLAVGDSLAEGDALRSGAVYLFTRSGTEWGFEQKLQVADGVDADAFGRSVGIGDNTLIVGAGGRDDNGTDSGAVYVCLRTETTWEFHSELFPQDGAAQDEFGTSVAMAGNTIVVGVNGDGDAGSEGRGAAYVFTRAAGAWNEQQKLLAGDGAADDYFGSAISVDEDTVVVGAPWTDTETTEQVGTVYVYRRGETGWVLEWRFIGAEAGEKFGNSVSLSGDTLAVGAPGNFEDSGIVYLYIRSGSTWTNQDAVYPNDDQKDDLFGTAVSLEGETFVAGAPGGDEDGKLDVGSAYVFTRTGASWSEELKLLAQTAGGAADDEAYADFGEAVSFSGDTLVVGSRSRGAGEEYTAGAAYVYLRSGGDWGIEKKLLARLPDGSADFSSSDYFGELVSISGEVLVVGAPFNTANDVYESGAAYVYRRSGSIWSAEKKLFGELPGGIGDGEAEESFGDSVSSSGDSIIVGAKYHGDGAIYRSGAAYYYSYSDGNWNATGKLSA